MNLVKSFHGNIEASANVMSEIINVENISNNSTNKNPSRFTTTDPIDILNKLLWQLLFLNVPMARKYSP